MIINCPNCGVAYNIDPSLIPEGGRKLRCTNCGEVFLCDPSNVEEPAKLVSDIAENANIGESVVDYPIEESLAKQREAEIIENHQAEQEDFDNENYGESEIGDDIESDDDSEKPLEEGLETVEISNVSPEEEMQEIFQRLSEEQKGVIEEEKKLGFFSKVFMKIGRIFGIGGKGFRRLLYLIILALIVSTLYYSRFQIVRAFPQLKPAYDYLNIQSVIPGDGLVFTNISRREYEVDDVMQMEIKGFIDNRTIHRVSVPSIHVEILDKNAEVLQVVEVDAPIEMIPANNKAAFRVIIPKPSVLSKYVLITFKQDNKR